MSRFVRFAAAAALVSLSAGPAFAETRLAIPCPNGPPCDMTLTGYVDTIGTVRLPWAASVIAPAGVCIYAQVTASDGAGGAEARPVIVTPDGKVAGRKDVDAAVPSTVAGWHTVEVDTPIGAGEQLFTLFLSLYPSSTCNRYGPPR